MIENDNRRFLQAQLARRQQPPVAGEDAGVGIDQYWRGPAELHDAGRDARHLLVRMRARIPGVGNQLVDRPALDLRRLPDLGRGVHRGNGRLATCCWCKAPERACHPDWRNAPARPSHPAPPTAPPWPRTYPWLATGPGWR